MVSGSVGAGGEVDAEVGAESGGLQEAGASAIELVGLSKTFGTGKRAVPAVRGIDLCVERAQVYGFLGANGAGKSTTIRMIVDLVRPTTGSVRLFGRDVAADRTALRRVGALVEGALFYPHLTGRKNLEVLARTGGRYVPKEVTGLLERLDLSDRADRPVEGYSMGMKQRLGVAAALLGKPELLILDEPTNGLDPQGIRDMREFLRQLVDDEGLTVFLSSHLLVEVEQVCDRVAIVHQGELVREGSVEELLAGEGRLRLEVAPVARARALLAQRWPVEEPRDPPPPEGISTATNCESTPSVLFVRAPAQATPEIVRRLAEAGVLVHGVERQRRSLEDFFFEATDEGLGAGEPKAEELR